MPKAKAETINLRLRIRVELLRRLEEAAEKDHRPVASEILRRLEASFQQDLVLEAAKAVEKSMFERVGRELEALRQELSKQLTRYAERNRELENLTLVRDSRTGFRLVPKSRTKPRKGSGLRVLRKAKEER